MRPARPSDTPPTPPPLRIVLAEDDSDQRFVLAAMLRSDGYRVSETGDGHALQAHLEEMVPAADDPPPDVLVVSDFKLRGPDALTVLRALRTQGRSPRFILFTGFWSSQLYSDAKSLGAVAVFAKPFDFEDLRIVIRYLERGELRD